MFLYYFLFDNKKFKIDGFFIKKLNLKNKIKKQKRLH